MKRKRKLWLILVLALTFSFVGTGIQIPQVNAATYTQKSVKAKIKKLKEQNKKLQKTYSSQLAKEKKQKKGTKAIYGDMISRDPLIIKSLDGSVYWVNKPENMNYNLYSAYGYVKLSGSYKTYNNYYTCAVCTAVKVSNASVTTKQKIDKNKELLRDYERMLKTKIIFAENPIILYEGDESQELDYRYTYNVDKYNSINFKTTDTEVVYFDDNKLVPNKEGTAYIIATPSISKRQSKVKVIVKPVSETIEGLDTVTIYANSTGNVCLRINNGYNVRELFCISSDTSVVDTPTYAADNIDDINRDGYCYIDIPTKNPGEADIEIYFNSLYAKTIHVIVKEEPASNDNYYYDDDDDSI